MTEVKEIPIGNIKVGEHEQRLDLEDEGIEELARSIGRLGVLVPLHVKSAGDAFTVVCGHRRLRAAGKAGLDTLPCIVLSAEVYRDSEISFAENFFRKDLSPVELACAITDCFERTEMTLAELAAGFHRSEHWVMKMMAITNWPKDVLEAIHEGYISASSGANLALVTDTNYRNFLVRNAVEQGATARTTASWLQAWRAMQPAEEAIASEPVSGRPAVPPLVPQAPCLCCGQIFEVNRMSHVPVCGGCIQIIRKIGTSVDG